MATIKLVEKDLFTMPQGYCLAHCISADFAMGAGIAVEFNNRYCMKNRLKEIFGEDGGFVGEAIKIDNVYNLITKERYFQKPTYTNLKEALKDMASKIEDDGVTKLAMPKIGAGLDRLDWEIVLSIIKSTFCENDNLEIVICFLKGDKDFPVED